MENVIKNRENFMALNVEGKNPYNVYILFEKKDRIYDRVKNLILDSQQYNSQLSEADIDKETSYISTYDRATKKTRWWKYILSKDSFPFEGNFNVYISQKVKRNEIIVGMCSCEPETIGEVDVNPLFSKSGACKAVVYWASLAMYYLGYKKVSIGILSTNYISACICYLNGVSQVWNYVRLRTGSEERDVKRIPDKDNKNALERCSSENIVGMTFYRSESSE